MDPVEAAGPRWADLLATLLAGHDLEAAACRAAFDAIMAGAATPAQMGAFLVALRAKGESAAEVDAAAAAMLAQAVPLPVPGPTLDIVGTGGDRAGTVNISTLAALVAAATGARVVKHGNRAATSSAGAADVLEELGIPVDVSPEIVAQCSVEVGIGFAFAPVFHPAMRHAGPVRRELGIPTVFNILGPLTNPARPTAGLIGCADARLAPIMAEVFARRGDSVLVVRGEDGWDEITPQAPTRVWWTAPGAARASGAEVRETRLDPVDLGIDDIPARDLAGGDARANAEVARAVLGLPLHYPERPLVADPRAVARVVVVNAAAALVSRAVASADSADAPSDVLDTALPLLVREQCEVAERALASGAAAALLQRWQDILAAGSAAAER